MAQMREARNGEITEEVRAAAEKERMPLRELVKLMASGQVAVVGKGRKALAIGKSTRTKTNANVGTSPDLCDEDEEMRKLAAAEEAGADTIMDLSTGGNLLGI